MRTPTFMLAAAAGLLLAPPLALAQSPEKVSDEAPIVTSPPDQAPAAVDASKPAVAPARPIAKPEAITDPTAQVLQGQAYYYGRGVAQDYKQARSWYEKAAKQKDPTGLRRLGDMQAAGLGGKKDKKKAVGNWIAAEKGGDISATILVADAFYEDVTGQKDPKPGQFKFVGGVPESRIDDAIAWYEAALERDPRAEVKQRSKDALYVLKTLKGAAGQVKDK